MTPRPSTPEWKRMVFMALAGGVSLKKSTTPFGRFSKTSWVARFRDGSVCCVRDTKYEAAEFAVATLLETHPFEVRRLSGENCDLPDAANASKPAGRSPGFELRSSEQ